jgi:protein-tyrosine phosphatase
LALTLQQVIDLHSHVLAGIDDGPESVTGSLAIARAEAEAGVRTLVATPHVNWRYRNDAATIAQHAASLRELLDAEGIELDLRAGAEVAMTEVAELEPAELARLRLGGGEWLLLEPPFSPIAAALEPIVQSVQRGGSRVLLAHPERCPAFHRDPSLLRTLVGEGVLTSITAGSLVGRFGSHVRRFALQLAQEQLVHNVASDAHDVAERAPGLASELEQAGLGALTEWLTEAVPAAILDGGPVPARPLLAVSSGGRGRRLRLRR